jgi:hypothetical protein
LQSHLHGLHAGSDCRFLRPPEGEPDAANGEPAEDGNDSDGHEKFDQRESVATAHIALAPLGILQDPEDAYIHGRLPLNEYDHYYNLLAGIVQWNKRLPEADPSLRGDLSMGQGTNLPA